MIHAEEILPVTQVKKELMQLLKRLQKQGGTVAITKDGSAAGILMGLEDYEGLMETLEILQDRSLMKSLTKALREHRQGKYHSHREVFKS